MIDFENKIGYRRREHKNGIIPEGERELIPGQNPEFHGKIYSLDRH